MTADTETGAHHMRIALFANNAVGAAVAQFLRARGDDVVAFVLHDSATARSREQIERAAAPGTVTLDATDLRSSAGIERLAAARPDIGVSAFFGHILRKNVIDLFSRGIVNIHSGLLPYNRGAHPNIWTIVDRTPAGVTIHYIDEGVDTGDVIAQRSVVVEPTDTGQTLYLRLERSCIELFEEIWPAIADGSAPRAPQIADEGSLHRARDIAAIDEIDLDVPTTARVLIDRIRARTFPPHDGAYFIENGRKVQLRLELFEASFNERGNSR